MQSISLVILMANTKSR